MKPSDIAKIAAIVAAGGLAYYVATRFRAQLGAGFDKARELAVAAGDAIKVGAKVVAAGPGAQVDANGDRIPVGEQLRALNMGAGDDGTPLSTAERSRLTGGSGLLSDAERRALRAMDSADPAARGKSIYDLYTTDDQARMDSLLDAESARRDRSPFSWLQ